MYYLAIFCDKHGMMGEDEKRTVQCWNSVIWEEKDVDAVSTHVFHKIKSSRGR